MLLSVACAFWVGYRFVQSGMIARVARASIAEALAWHIAAAIPVYTAAVLVLGSGWWMLQSAYARVSPRLGDTLVCYIITQFGKYLPGNVVQYVGRHVVLKRWGMSHVVLLACALTEAVFLLAAALMCGSGMIDTLVPWLPAWLLLVVLPIALLIGAAMLKVVVLRVARWRTYAAGYAPLRLLPAGLSYLVFFGLMALTLEIVAAPFSATGAQVLLLPAAASLSWVAGYLVIGAPAGIGVREAVFLALLHGHLAENDVLLLVAGFRVATFGGDLLAFLLGLPFGARLQAPRIEPLSS